MPVSTHPKGMNDVVLVFKDGTTPTAVSYTVTGVMNNFTVSGLKGGSVLNARTRHSSRGKKTGITYADREYPSGSFSFECTQLTHATGGCALDFIKRKGFYASNISKEGTGTRQVYTFDIEITILGATEYGDDDDHVFTLVGVDVTDIAYSDGDPNSFAISFDCDNITGDLESAELA